MPDGSIAVIVPSPNALKTMSFAEIVDKDKPIGGVVISDTATIADVPSDRTYRDAWKRGVGPQKIDHDMVKAREIHRNHMRRARAPLMEALDVEVMRKVEAGQPVGPLAAQKQALRDVTADPAIDNAQDVASLKQVWPAVLGPNPLV